MSKASDLYVMLLVVGGILVATYADSDTGPDQRSIVPWPIDALSDEYTVVAWDAPGCAVVGSAADVPVALLRRLAVWVRPGLRDGAVVPVPVAVPSGG